MFKSVNQALETARAFMDLLEEMEAAYDASQNASERWIYRDQEVLRRWIRALETASTPEDLNDLWREVQDISRILGCAIMDELGDRYRKLQSKFFQDMTAVIADARRSA